jgi:hypothetical protein
MTISTLAPKYYETTLTACVKSLREDAPLLTELGCVRKTLWIVYACSTCMREENIVDSIYVLDLHA